MATLSLDLRQRILASYDKEEGTREQIAWRYGVSLGMVKKLLQQRRRTGCIKARHHLAGRKPTIVAEHRIAMRQHLKRKPDLTLAELRDAVGLSCTLPAVHYVLADMGLTYKKRRSAQPSKTARTSVRRDASGGGTRAALSQRGSSSSTKAGRRPT
jgi:transposase